MNFLADLFTLNFLRNALFIGVLAAPALGVIGTLIVTKRIASLAGASAHAALGGMGIALYLARVCQLTFISPMHGAIAGAVGAAMIVGVISLRAKEREDTVIGVVWALGMAIGLLFLSRTPGYVDWQGYLFGNILLIARQDFLWMALLDAVILLPVLLFYRKIVAFFFDQEFAALRGIRGTICYLTILALTALTIVLLINLVGIILVIALLTLPAATAGCFARHLHTMMITAGILSALFVAVGVVTSFALQLPTGPVIVVAAGIVYVGALILRKIRR